MSNNDNAMTRFLFAILRQKCLKDIDWNKVAHDPILAQPITNGHAARMRYSRFRSAMLGLEPQRRNRTTAGNNKNRVSKSKKEARTVKEEQVKPEPQEACHSHPTPEVGRSPHIKQEQPRHPYEARFTPTPMPPAVMTTTSHVIQPRLLTPCSDTDNYLAQNAYASPSADMATSQSALDFVGHSHNSQDSVGWNAAHNMYGNFDAAYEMGTYGAGTCEHNHNHQSPDDMGDTNSLLSGNDDLVALNIKHEDWDAQYQV